MAGAHARGHIGVGIGLLQRGRGLGKLLLKLSFAEARKHGIAQVMYTAINTTPRRHA